MQNETTKAKSARLRKARKARDAAKPAISDAIIDAAIDAVDAGAKPETVALAVALGATTTDIAPAPAKPAKPAKPALRPGVYAAYRGEIEIDRDSVPIKPASQFKPAHLYAGTCANVTMRQARAFRFLANHSGLRNLEIGSTVPRFVTDSDGVNVCLENGCARDMLGSGLVTFAAPDNGDGSAPGTMLKLTEHGYKAMRDNALAKIDHDLPA